MVLGGTAVVLTVVRVVARRVLLEVLLEVSQGVDLIVPCSTPNTHTHTQASA